MAQQIINTGEEPNDGTGEPLRSAFTAVNENFSEIYAAGPVGSNVVISANTISRIGTNGNLILSANGVGNVQFNSSIEPTVNAVFSIGNPSAQFKTIYAENFIGNGAGLTGIGGGGSGNSINNGASNVVIATQDGNVTVSVDGSPNVAVFQKRNVAFTANILPTANTLYDIGSANQRFRDLYLAGETIFLGNAQLSANAGSITITNPAGGRFIFSGSGDFGPYGNSSVENFLPTYTGNLRSLQGNVWTTANVRASNLLANNLVSTQNLSVTGNIVGLPGVTRLSNVIVDVSTATVSTLTVTDSVTGAGSLSLVGNVTGGNINTGGNITAVDVTAAGNIVTGSGQGGNISGANVISANTFNAGTVSVTGNITADYFIGNGQLLTGLPDAYSNANVASYLLTNTGNIAAGTFISDRFVSTETLTLTANGANLKLFSDAGTPVMQPEANTSLLIRTQNDSTYQLEFNSDGELSVPTAVYTPLVSTIDVVTNTIRSDDSSSVLVDDALNVRGVIHTEQSVSATGNVITDSFFLGNGRMLSGVVATSVGTVPTITVTGNIVSGNITNQGIVTTTSITATGNIVGATGAGLDGFVIGAVTPENARFDDVEVLGNLSVLGTTSTANITANGAVSITGQVTAQSINSIGNAFAGNINTAQIVATGISATSLSTTGNVTAAFFIGNGSLLTGLPSTYSNADVAVFLPTYTGNLVSLQGDVATTANINANNVTVSNLLSTSRLITTGNAVIGGNLVVNGNTIQINVEELNVEDPIIGIGRGANNTPLSVDDGRDRGLQLWYYDDQELQAFVGWDTANSTLLAAANVSVNNEIVTVNDYGQFVTGNITATSVTATGNIVTGAGSGGNISGANVISANTVSVATVSATTISAAGNAVVGGALSVTGNVTANTYFGSADGLTFIPAGNIVGTVALAESSNTAATITANNQPNITGVGTLTALTVAGNVAVDTDTFLIREDLNAVGIGGVPTNKLTVIDAASAVNNLQRSAVFYSSNIQSGNIGIIQVGRDSTNQAEFGYLYAGNANANNSAVLRVNNNTVLSINSANVASFNGNIQAGTILIDRTNAALSGLAEINSTVVTATANITAGNFVTAGNVISSGNVQSNNVSVGNLIQATTASVIGNITAANVTVANISSTNTIVAQTIDAATINATGNISAIGNVTAAFFVGNLVGSFTAPGSNTQVLFNEDGVIAARSGLIFDYVGNTLTVGGNIATNNAGSLNVAGAISVVGNITVSTGNINGGNILGSRLSVSGNITGGNIDTTGRITAVGNITGGNINTAGTVSATGNVTTVGNISAGNITTSGTLSATGTVTVGNVSTVGFVSATANITAGNINTAGRVSATGNVNGGNINSAGRIVATGNIITSEFFVGNFLGNISGNISVTGSNTQILFNNDGNVGAAAGLTFDTDANLLSIMGNISATGNITGANLITNGSISVTGNVDTGNVNTAGLSLTGNVLSTINSTNDIVTTGNISANNIAVTTSININGVQVATVDDATALAIALG
jgi:hypothetical protein